VEIGAKGGKLLGEGVEHCENRHQARVAAWRRGITLQKQALREGSCLEKGFNISEMSTEGRKLHCKHPQRSASQKKGICIVNCSSYVQLCNNSTKQPEHFFQVKHSFSCNHDLRIK
jgi:hypothetical protein